MNRQLDCGGRSLNLARPQVMGILNVTPDSFSDGGRYAAVDDAVAQAQQMVMAGAAIIDIGGESTRPGAQAVTAEEELSRVIPVIEALHEAVDVPISIDTSKAEVAIAAVGAGAGLVNDVYALREPGMVEAVADLGVPVCLMHMQGEPRTMQEAPHYDNVVAEVVGFLEQRAQAVFDAGIARDRILIDPGFGFGKSLQHNLMLMHELSRLVDTGYPVLVGASRKSMVGEVLDRPVDQRLYGSVALAVLAAWQGAAIIRVHDVAATVDALKMCDAVTQSMSDHVVIS